MVADYGISTWRLRQQDHAFEASIGHFTRCCLHRNSEYYCVLIFELCYFSIVAVIINFLLLLLIPFNMASFVVGALHSPSLLIFD